MWNILHVINLLNSVLICVDTWVYVDCKQTSYLLQLGCNSVSRIHANRHRFVTIQSES